jgi:uncharacterized repeat protein (TIGR01451 family)
MRGWIVAVGLLLWIGAGAALRADNYTPEKLRHIDLITKEILYDPISRKIYASVPGEAGPGGNSVVPIDPVTGDVGIPILVGSQPGHLAVSDDGKYLYVALETGDIRRIDLTTRKPAGLFHVGGVRQIAVIPGQHDLLAVSRGGGAGLGDGVALFDNGVLRPGAGSPNGFALTFGPRLYTYQNEISSWDFNTYAIESTGLVLRASTGGLLIGNLGIRGDGNGRVYTNLGTVIDPEAQRVIARLPGGSYDSTPIPDPTVNRIFFLNGSRITSDDYSTFVALDTMELPGIRGGNLIRWGADGLAFRTEKQVYWLRSRMVGKPVTPADLSVTATHAPPWVTVGRSIACKLVVVNNGPGPATGVMLTFRMPAGLEVVSAQSTAGQVTTAERLVSVDIGDLGIKARCTLTVVVTPVGAAKFVTTAVVRANPWDNHPENNLVDHVINNMGPAAAP